MRKHNKITFFKHSKRGQKCAVTIVRGNWLRCWLYARRGAGSITVRCMDHCSRIKYFSSVWGVLKWVVFCHGVGRWKSRSLWRHDKQLAMTDMTWQYFTTSVLTVLLEQDGDEENIWMMVRFTQYMGLSGTSWIKAVVWTVTTGQVTTQWKLDGRRQRGRLQSVFKVDPKCLRMENSREI